MVSCSVVIGHIAIGLGRTLLFLSFLFFAHFLAPRFEATWSESVTNEPVKCCHFDDRTLQVEAEIAILAWVYQIKNSRSAYGKWNHNVITKYWTDSKGLGRCRGPWRRRDDDFFESIEPGSERMGIEAPFEPLEPSSLLVWALGSIVKKCFLCVWEIFFQVIFIFRTITTAEEVSFCETSSNGTVWLVWGSKMMWFSIGKIIYISEAEIHYLIRQSDRKSINSSNRQNCDWYTGMLRTCLRRKI